MALRAPIAGIVVERKGVLGTLATSETSLATVADPGLVSALIDVREDDASRVRAGQTVVVEIDGVRERAFTGTIEWIAPVVDPRTRTVRVRAGLANHEGLLRSNQFGRALITVEPGRAGVVVPRESVQRHGDGSLVFVRTGPGVYEPRPVSTGASKESLVTIAGDVKAGDAVVTTGAFLLKTELSRDGIGAGCCEVNAPTEKR
jgi:cobalt-zinc-cadmium efflux system membrane fusion protein